VAEGRQHHLTGQWDQALACYQQVLTTHADHFDAAQLAGTLCLQGGEPQAALHYLNRALAIRPEAFFVWGHRATALLHLERPSEALTDFNHAISLKPDYRDGYNNRGLCHMAMHQWQDALADFDRALSLVPHAPDTLMNQGIVLSKLNRFTQAQVAFEKALALNPNVAEAYSNLGNLHLERGMSAQAIAYFHKALTLRAHYPEAWLNLGNAHRQLEQTSEALAAYQRAVDLAPSWAPAWRALGLAFKDAYRFSDAVTALNKAIELDPEEIDAYINRGNAHMELGRFEAALADFEFARAASPAQAPLWVNCGNAYEALERLDDALACHSMALTLDPEFIEAYSNRGHVQLERLDLPAALADFEAALQRQPEFGDARWNRALAWLQSGRLADGFKEYEWRWHTERGAGRRFRRHFAQPLWLGEGDLRGKTLLVYAEQGLGDTLQFARFIPMLEALGARVIFEVQRPLVPLLSAHLLHSHATVIAKGDALPDFDWQVPIMSLASAFQVDLASVPHSIPYIEADPVRVAKVTSVLNTRASGRFKIAIAWKGNTRGLVDRRAFALERFKSIAEIPGVELISVQKNEGSEELHQTSLGFQVTTFPEPFDDVPFLDTAAVFRAVDLIITSDTSLTHLAGALGCHTFLPLRFAAEWRWLLDRSDSPWYPNHRLFRQPVLGDWESVFTHMRHHITAMMDRQG